MTSVYVIGPEGGPYKIGVAVYPQHRAKELQTGNPYRLVVHYEVPVTEGAALEVEGEEAG